MYLDEVLAAQKQGRAVGIPSVCSAHPQVIQQALRSLPYPLIEATCNQVNQFGGYTGMRPADFVALVRAAAAEVGAPVERLLLGGDHLGPHVWRGESAANAMAKARNMIAAYAEAGFTKLHLDCSMPLADDPPGPLEKAVVARRAAELAKVAEQRSVTAPRYVIGTEVPRPGGALSADTGPAVTHSADVRDTLEIHFEAFHAAGLDYAWQRVLAVVVQPGVEFGDDVVHPYRPEAAAAMRSFIETQPMVYEAHSTDYQTAEDLQRLVQDHFAILKVGPALTFAYREAIFALAMIEDELLPASGRSNIRHVLEDVMLARPEHWQGYYQGTSDELRLKRAFSLSDRVRYYWAQPEVQHALQTLLHNLGPAPLPYSLSSQYLGRTGLSALQAIHWKIAGLLDEYAAACGGMSLP